MRTNLDVGGIFEKKKSFRRRRLGCDSMEFIETAEKFDKI